MATKKRSRRGQAGAKIGLALAGGGAGGATYEIGALRALNEVLEGVDFNDLHIYVGVSAGSGVAATLANGITTGDLCRSIVNELPGEPTFSSETFFTPSLREWSRRGSAVPRLLWEAVRGYARNPRDRSLLDSLTRLGRALPVGIFDNDRIRAYLEKMFTIKGRTDDFRRLRRPLVIVAADLDSGEPVRFGEEGLDAIPISVAVQASTALPGLYPPVEIDGRHYVDGVLLKTMHGSVALEAGTDLLLCLNPLVPVDTAAAVQQGVMRRGKLIDRGLVTVLSQTLRTLIRSRLATGLAAYRKAFPDSDVVLFEPRRDDYLMFFLNVFSVSSRRIICEHAYRETRRELLERRDELAPVLARHGVTLRVDLLESERDLWRQLGVAPVSDADSVSSVAGDLDRVLDRLDAALESR